MATRPRRSASEPADHVDALRAQWSAVLPALDTSPMGILGRIHRIARLVAPDIETLFASHGIDRPEFDVLASLRRAGPPHRLSPTALCRSLLVASGRMTHRLDRLESAGLIERRPSPTDRRGCDVQLTAAGRKLVDRAFAEDMALETELLASLSREQRDDLAGLLRHLLVGLESRAMPV